MLQIVNEVRKKDSARRVFTIFYDRFFTRTLYQPREHGKANLHDTLIVLCNGHENGPVLKSELEYKCLLEKNDSSIHSAIHNTPLISHIIGVKLKRI